MRPHRLTAALALLVCSDGAALAAMSAEEFAARTTGKTLLFRADGAPYGAEEYREGQRVRWSFLDGQCLEGRWYEDAGRICFVYDDRPDAAQCWLFEPDGPRFSVRFDGDDATLYSAEPSAEPLLCLGPEIGV
ncbi:hypothetical protein [Poseidonocella sedimentorum]|nr:hypothetical protein [Poseidonocella sedimentorum]